MSIDTMPKILFVEGQSTSFGHHLASLEKAGFEVESVPGAKAALQRLRDMAVDVILMDVTLSDMSGHELCKLLKKDSQFESIPVVFLAADEGEDEVRGCFDVGGSDYLHHQVNVTEMIYRIRTQYQLACARRAQVRERRILSAVMGTIKDVACCIDVSGKVLFANTPARKWFGTRAEGKDYFELSTGREHLNAVFHVRDAMENGSYYSEDVLADDALREVTVSPIYDDGGDVMAVFVINKDAKAKVDYEERVRDVQKMASLGRLAGGAIRDLDTVLSEMVGYLSLLRDQLEDEAEVFGFFKALLTTNDQAGAIVNQLLDFLEQHAPVPTVFVADAALHDLTPYLERSLSDEVTCAYSLEASDARLEMDIGEFKILVANLLYAADAEIEGRGDVEISTRTEPCPQAERTLIVFSVRIKLSDTPSGVAGKVPSDENMALDVVRYLVDCHDGRFKIEAAPDSVAFTASFFTQEEQIVSEPNMGKKVLVVDDEPVIRHMLKDCFDILGYEGIFASSGEEGVDTFKKAQGEVGLVLLDMVMPGIGGEEVLSEIREMDPDTPVVISSAHANSKSSPNLVTQPDGWLDKPFKITELKAVLERFISKN